MTGVEVRELSEADEYFVATCSHVGESAELDASGDRRRRWLRKMRVAGLRVVVALVEGGHAGFAYLVPIESSPWGPVGQDLMVLPCLWVLPAFRGRGAGRALLNEAVKEAARRERRGIVTIGYDHDFWFMPASFFEHFGFTRVRQRGEEVILWRVFKKPVDPPRFLRRRYASEPVPGRVVVDLFWNRFCLTSDIEADRVRRVAGEFGDRVLLREHPADDRPPSGPEIARGIYVDGREIGWGYEAPEEGIRDAIRAAMQER